MKTGMMATVLVFSLVLLSYADNVKLYTSFSPPLAFEDNSGKKTGFSFEVAEELQRRVGNTIEIRVLPWARAYKYCLEDSNVSLFTASRNKDRENKFHWIMHLTTRRSAFFAKKGSPLVITSMEDAKKVKAIGVVRNGNRYKYLVARGFFNFQIVNREKQNVRKLLAGRIDLIFQSSIEAASNLKQSGETFDKVESKYTVFQNDSYIMMSKNGTPMSTVKKWQAAARNMKKDGTFGKIAEKWIKYMYDNYGLKTQHRNGALYFWKD